MVSASSKLLKLRRLLVGAEGFEPPTLCSQSRCATRLRYAPILPIVSHPGGSSVTAQPRQKPEQ